MENLKFEVIDGKLKIPEGVTSIEDDTIDSPYSVKELIIPESVQKIAIDAFKDCTKLEKVTIPAKFVYFPEDQEKMLKYSYSFDRIFNGCDKIKSIVFTGNKKKMDFSSWSWGNGYTESIYAKIFRFHKPVIYIEGEITRLKVGEKFGGRNYNNGQYQFYINTYIENVEVEGTDKWTDKDLFFRAPKANGKVDGKLVELTLCPRKSFYDDKRWSCPITLHSDAVTYIHGIELDCYEEQVAPNVSKNKHIGSRIALVGRAPHELTQEEQIEYTERFPYVVVWESPEFVVSKLKQAGWHI